VLDDLVRVGVVTSAGSASPKIAEVLPLLYRHGLSSGDFDCARRGMRAPVLAVGDCALGFWKALQDIHNSENRDHPETAAA
jgi:hypothetical protein